MVAWGIWTVLVAAINLTLFIAVRGRWGRLTPFLALAAAAGTAAGNFIASLTGAELIVLGEFHLVAACIGAQLAMLVTVLVASLASPLDRLGTRRDAGGPGR